jgi:hypothetical protein
LQYLAWAALAVGSLATLWKIILPALKIISRIMPLVEKAEATVPLLVELTREFQGSVGAFAALRRISDQFYTDGGKSLREVVSGLDSLLRTLQMNYEVMRELDAKDREKAVMIEEQLHRLSAAVEPIESHKEQMRDVLLQLEELARKVDSVQMWQALRSSQLKGVDNS